MRMKRMALAKQVENVTAHTCTTQQRRYPYTLTFQSLTHKALIIHGGTKTLLGLDAPHSVGLDALPTADARREP